MSNVANNHRSKPGISGRRATVAVVGSLVMVLLVSGYGLWMYSRFEQSRELATASWRNVAAELSVRYRDAEKLVAQGIDAQMIDIALGEKFRLALDGFSTTTQFEPQIVSAGEVERELEAIENSLEGRPEATALLEQWKQGLGKPQRLNLALENYSESVETDARLRTSFGGKLLLFFIKLREPREFQVLTVLPNSRIL